MKFIVCVLAFLVSQPLWAQTSRANAVEDYKDDTWAITFGTAISSTTLDHQESSVVPDYSTPDNRLVVPDIKMSLSLQKEFSSESRFSFTARVLGGVTSSEGQTVDDDTDDQYKEDLSSIHFGAGLYVNYNLYDFGFKIQPYVGASFIKETGEFNLTHEGNGATLNTIHEFDSTFINPAIGVRVFDADVGLMSYFEISAPSVMSETVTPKAQANGNDIDIDSDTELQRLQVAFSLGFGVYF